MNNGLKEVSKLAKCLSVGKHPRKRKEPSVLEHVSKGRGSGR